MTAQDFLCKAPIDIERGAGKEPGTQDRS